MQKCLLNIIELTRAAASNEKLVQKSANKERKKIKKLKRLNFNINS